MKGVWKKYAITPFACFSFSKVLLKKILFIGYLVVRGEIGMGQDLNKPHDASREAPVHLWLYRQICKETFFYEMKHTKLMDYTSILIKFD